MTKDNAGPQRVGSREATRRNTDWQPRGPDGKFATIHGGRTRVPTEPAAARMARLRRALTRDQGCRSWNELSAAQRVLIRRIAFKAEMLAQVEAFLASRGAVAEDGQVRAPLDERYLALSNSLRHDVSVLGLKRRAPAEESLDAIRRRYDVRAGHAGETA